MGKPSCAFDLARFQHTNAHGVGKSFKFSGAPRTNVACLPYAV